MEQNRIKWLDSLKGIGILLVILGHVPFPFKQYIYWFHMPLFFIISGLTMKVNDDRKLFYKKKFKALIVPYITWGTLFIILYGTIEKIDLFKEIGKFILFWGTKSSGYVGAYWYLPSLFVSQIVFFEMNYFKNIKVKFFFLIAISILSFSGFSQFKILPFVIAYLFFGRNILLKIIENNYLILINFFLSLIMLLVGRFYVFELDLKYGLISNMLLAIVIPITFSYLLIIYTYKFNNLFQRLKVPWLGKNSLYIMLFHNFFIFNINKYFTLNWFYIFILSVGFTLLSVYIYINARERFGMKLDK